MFSVCRTTADRDVTCVASSGKGQVIDCSMTEGAAYVSSWLFKARDMLPVWGQEPGQNM